MKTRKLKPNQVVTVYSDPLSEKDAIYNINEGQQGESAILIKKDEEISEPGFLEYWLCGFTNGTFGWAFIKPIIIFAFLILSGNCFSQKFYNSQEYYKEAYKYNILCATVIPIKLNPFKLGIGAVYISKPIIEIKNFPVSYLLSGEYLNYSFIDYNYKLTRLNIGVSFVIETFNLNISPSFNIKKNNENGELSQSVTFEIGAMNKFDKTYVLISIDPILPTVKFGLGLGF